MEIKAADIVLCEFYFSDLKISKNRPVLVFKDNLPFDDFIGIPISSQIVQLYADEIIIKSTDFSQGMLPKPSKLMFRKPFIVSKKVVIKKYGTLYSIAFNRYQKLFCDYFQCCE